MRLTQLAVLGFACAFGMTPAAAQTATGTMAPVQATASAPKTLVPLSKSTEFASLSAAAAYCPKGIVVWSTLSKSHSYHLSASRYYGKTKKGAYVCLDDAVAAGFHQAKS